ncbi:MAG: CDP-alcohol phosphatidyltransferase family protein, partial [Acidobacteriota bacterium]
MKHVPNILSAARLLAAPYVFVLLWYRDYPAALVWMAIIGATDGLDGYIARRFNAQSRLGAMLDPVADKVLLSGSFLTLGLSGAIPAWLAWVVLGRDAAILGFVILAILFMESRRDFPPSFPGKLSTAIQIAYVLTVTGAGAGYLPALIPGLGQWAVALVTAWSGMDYARIALAMRTPLLPRD